MKSNWRLNDRFELMSDPMNWVLREHYEGKDKHGNPKPMHKDRYFATPGQCIEEAASRRMKECSGLNDTLAALEEISAAADRLTKAIAQSVKLYS